MRDCERDVRVGAVGPPEARAHLVRDRLGIKPLYWGRAGGALVFGSELKALRCASRLAAGDRPRRCRRYPALRLCAGAAHIYRGVHKLEPGTMLTLGADGEPRARAAIWICAHVAARRCAPMRRAKPTRRRLLEALLRDAVRRAGWSPTCRSARSCRAASIRRVVALMQARARGRCRPSPSASRADGFDEAQHAKRWRAHLGTEHTELYVDARATRSTSSRAADMYDEPFADSSQIPTYLVSRVAREHVTVALSGDGGDELFGGYNALSLGREFWRALAAPRAMRRGAAGMLGLLPQDVGRRSARFAPARLRPAFRRKKRRSWRHCSPRR